ncbi:MAG: ABC transporter permease [Deltaproteobacteria bacterium]|jgi:simple sugar transport system permease protein|nr:ABC transporter permease [Deltaproteobacteria bacterium]
MHSQDISAPVSHRNLTGLIGQLHTLSVPVAAVLLGALIGAIILAAHGANPFKAYAALLQGAFGTIIAVGRTFEKTTPLIFSGLAVAFAFKAGLFNIGAQGQLLFGALAAAIVGYGLNGLPMIIHLPLALFAGAAAGALYAAIQGALRVYTGAHEVITGIMLNYVAINLTDYLAGGPFKDPTPGNIIARTPLILDSSKITDIGGLPTGFIVALMAAAAVWWLVKQTTAGFEIRTVGLNVHAAGYAGIKVSQTMILAMALGGLLAGLGGAVETLGVVHRYQPGFNVGLGFDGITIALLARTHPLGVIPAALLVGAMKAGSNQMQFSAGVAIGIIDVVLALILFFVAAELVVRWLIRSKPAAGEKITFSAGWGKK